jgi:hypothetical protein
MKTILLSALLLLSSAVIAKAESPQCTLTITGVNANFMMGYFFKGEFAHPKSGWTVKADPTANSGTTLAIYDHGIWEDTRFGIRVTIQGKLSTSDNDQPMQISGFGYLPPGSGCGQPALSAGYKKVAIRLKNYLRKNLPECTPEEAQP